MSVDEVDPSTLDSGALLINFGADVYGQIIDDQCSGTVDLTVTDGKIAGTASCAFQGALAAFISGDQVASVSGTVTDATANGVLELDVSGQAIEFKWDGTADGSAVYGAFSGGGPFEAGDFTLELVYAGGFNAPIAQ